MTRAELRKMILDAFAGTSAPTAPEITDTCWDLDLERDAIRAAFAGRLWHELPASVFTVHRQALFLLTARAWAYYLPAYMLAAMKPQGDGNGVLREVVATLLPDRDREIDELRKERIRALSESQKRTLLQFIEWAGAEYPDDLDEDDRTTVVADLRAEVNS